MRERTLEELIGAHLKIEDPAVVSMRFLEKTKVLVAFLNFSTTKKRDELLEQVKMFTGNSSFPLKVVVCRDSINSSLEISFEKGSQELKGRIIEELCRKFMMDLRHDDGSIWEQSIRQDFQYHTKKGEKSKYFNDLKGFYDLIESYCDSCVGVSHLKLIP